jgi:leucine-rich PPR motif-containing protein
MESAASILNVMKQANVEPSAETYTVLMCGHAKRGDIDSIKHIMEDCKTANIHLFDKDILEVVYTLAINSHYGHIDEVIL